MVTLNPHPPLGHTALHDHPMYQAEEILSLKNIDLATRHLPDSRQWDHLVVGPDRHLEDMHN